MRVLIIDDEENIRKTETVLLEDMGHEVVGVENGANALKEIDKGAFDVAFLDLKLNGESGLDVLPEVLKNNPGIDVIVCTAFASVETAVEAIQRGAADYLPKPFTPEQIRQVLRKVIKRRKLEDRVADLESRLSHDSPTANLKTTEPAMEKMFTLAFKAAATPASILILGENGTGKSILARAIHDRSPQKENAFVTISCPSLSKDLLESELFGRVKGAFTGAVGDTWGKVAEADGGTLFLDEIGELPIEIQPKLLRLLQEKEYERVGEAKTRHANVRVIAATNRNLEKAVADGLFREDLYYRLNVIAVTVPPLRERLGDLKVIAEGYLQFFASQCGKRMQGFSPEVEEALRQYRWPGNVRELRNVIEHAVILATSEQVKLEDLPEKLTQAIPHTNGNGNGVQIGMSIPLADIEEEHIRRVMAKCANIDEAAQILGIGRSTLYKRKRK